MKNSSTMIALQYASLFFVVVHTMLTAVSTVDGSKQHDEPVRHNIRGVSNTGNSVRSTGTIHDGQGLTAQAFVTSTGNGTNAPALRNLQENTILDPYFTMIAGKGNAAMGEYNPDIATGNPLKGLCESPRYHYKSIYHNNINSSLEFYYMGLNEVMINDPDIVGENNAYNWTILENELNDSVSRNMHSIIRFIVHFPGKPLMIPQYLISNNINVQWYDSTNRSPYYGDVKLLKAFQQFIIAFGKKYDGDTRIAFIQMGLLGFWGEWHTNQHSNLLPKSTFDQINTWYTSSFKVTKIQARVNTQAIYNSGFGFHDDSFAYTTLDGWANGGVKVHWYFWSKIITDHHTNFWKHTSGVMGGETRPELQNEIFKPRYTSRTYQKQEFLECVRVTHTTYMLHHTAFKNNGYSGDELWHARNAHVRMGYNFQVYQIQSKYDTTSTTSTTYTNTGTRTVNIYVTIKQMGIAPFYYPLYLYVGCPDMIWRRLYTNIEKQLIDENSMYTWEFLHIPATTKCLNSIEISLDSPHVYKSRPIKFSQYGITNTGSIIVQIPLPDFTTTSVSTSSPISSPTVSPTMAMAILPRMTTIVPNPVIPSAGPTTGSLPVPISISPPTIGPITTTVTKIPTQHHIAPPSVVTVQPVVVLSPTTTSSPVTTNNTTMTTGGNRKRAISGFTLLNTKKSTPRPITTLVSNQIINLSIVGTMLSIGVLNDATALVSTMIFQWIDDKNQPRTYIVNKSPWVITQDDSTGNHWHAYEYIRYPGIKSIRVTALLNTIVLDVVTLSFTVIASSIHHPTAFVPNVFTGITLMNTSTIPATVIQPLQHGDVIDIGKVGTFISIQADTVRGKIGNSLARVQFQYPNPTSNQNNFFDDSNPPYSIAGGVGLAMNSASSTIFSSVGDKSLSINAFFWNNTSIGSISTTLFVVDSTRGPQRNPTNRTNDVAIINTGTSVTTRFILIKATAAETKQLRIIHDNAIIHLAELETTELSIHVEFDTVPSSTSSGPIKQVTFIWDTKTHTENEIPWSMGTNSILQSYPVQYLSTPGIKRVSIIAYNTNGSIVTNESILFTII